MTKSTEKEFLNGAMVESILELGIMDYRRA